MFGLLGPNGAGKTTLLSILSCLLKPTAGSARILGHDVYPGNKDLCRLIGIVPQDLAVYGELTARENLAFFGELYSIRGAELRQRVDQVLADIGLAERADGRVDTFSGGMKRRLNLGVALIHRPRLLMLDEPTTGVDPQSRNHIFESVRRLNSEGTSIIYTSHYMEEVQTLCRRIGIMDHGKLIACDTLPGLLRQLSGEIRFRVPAFTPALRDQVKALTDVSLREADDGVIALECRDVKQTLLQLVALLNQQNVELVHLETEEPNLERVFLHMTGHALRD
jgi:ABC-2 type transport system ATP-binding protein